MRAVSVFREVDEFSALLGPDWVHGLAGFGETPAGALRNLADEIAKYDYEIRGDRLGLQVADEFIEEAIGPDHTPADAIRALAVKIEAGRYGEADFPPPDWLRIAKEERLVPSGHNRN